MKRRLKLELLICVISFFSGCWFTVNFIQLQVYEPAESVDKRVDSNFIGENVFESHATQKGDSRLSYFLVVIVLSEPRSESKRNAVRQTWFKLSDRSNVKHFFTIATKNLPSEVMESLQKEQNENGDLVLFTDIVDSYNNLTLKMLKTYEWLWRSRYTYYYMLKCDDDTFIDTKGIVSDLEHNYGHNKSHRLYWGYFNGHAHVKKSGKWKESDWNLCDYYLPYALGGGFVLSETLVNFIAANEKFLKLFTSEDVSVGVWLAGVADIERRHDPRFNTEYISRGCSNSYLVSHKCTVDDMKQFYNTLIQTGKLCTSEYKVRNSYNYNWNVPPSKCCSRSD